MFRSRMEEYSYFYIHIYIYYLYIFSGKDLVPEPSDQVEEGGEHLQRRGRPYHEEQEQCGASGKRNYV